MFNKHSRKFHRPPPLDKSHEYGMISMVRLIMLDTIRLLGKGDGRLKDPGSTRESL
jgi:hypothetical protein